MRVLTPCSDQSSLRYLSSEEARLNTDMEVVDAIIKHAGNAAAQLPTDVQAAPPGTVGLAAAQQAAEISGALPFPPVPPSWVPIPVVMPLAPMPFLGAAPPQIKQSFLNAQAAELSGPSLLLPSPSGPSLPPSSRMPTHVASLLKLAPMLPELLTRKRSTSETWFDAASGQQSADLLGTVSWPLGAASGQQSAEMTTSRPLGAASGQQSAELTTSWPLGAAASGQQSAELTPSSSWPLLGAISGQRSELISWLAAPSGGRPSESDGGQQPAAAGIDLVIDCEEPRRRKRRLRQLGSCEDLADEIVVVISPGSCPTAEALAEAKLEALRATCNELEEVGVTKPGIGGH